MFYVIYVLTDACSVRIIRIINAYFEILGELRRIDYAGKEDFRRRYNEGTVYYSE